MQSSLSMTSFILLAYVLVASLLAVGNWRRGPFLVILLAAVQDPLRKLTPGAPPWMLLGMPVVFAATLMSLAAQNPAWWRQFRRWERTVAGGMLLFVAGMVIPVLIDLSYGFLGVKLAIIGFLYYGTALANLGFGFHYGLDAGLCRRLFRFYVLVTAVMMIGVPLDYWGTFPDWQALGTKAMNMEWVRYIPGRRIRMFAGFYRSPDVMGWHAITMSLLAILLSLGSRRFWSSLFWLALSGWGLVGVFLCGRRKFAYMVPIFLGVLVWTHRRQAARWVPRIALATAVTVGLFLVVYRSIGPSADVATYYFGTTGDIVARAEVHGIGAVVETFRQKGFLGTGLGSASSGTKHTGAGGKIDNWQEGGVSRLAVELGAFGLLCALYLAWVIWQRMLAVAHSPIRTDAHGLDFHKALLALAVANGASFVVSGQTFGDPFVGFFFSLFLGIMLAGDAMRRLAVSQNTTRYMSAIDQNPTPLLADRQCQTVEVR